MKDANRAQDGATDTAERAPRATLVWDLPLRLFHWLLAAAVAVSLYTGLVGGFEEMDWHQRSGFVVLGLVAFRILWGFLGPRHARFSSFLTGPAAVLAWLRAALRRSPPTEAGHNPLAGWQIVLLLLALSVQATTGLFSSDDLFVEGPLTHLVDDDTISTATSIHAWGQWTVGILVGLHLLALLAHRLLFGERLVIAMITGRRRGLADDAGIAGQRLLLAVPLAAAIAFGVYAIVTWL
ncbi:MAG TPA: cytochrome b/b6 domain-containing protein [Pseudomonadales bacterium]|nr:cytochrome b/b6 domain-containing protein [Pseudomonadales bacterium]